MNQYILFCSNTYLRIRWDPKNKKNYDKTGPKPLSCQLIRSRQTRSVSFAPVFSPEVWSSRSPFLRFVKANTVPLSSSNTEPPNRFPWKNADWIDDYNPACTAEQAAALAVEQEVPTMKKYSKSPGNPVEVNTKKWRDKQKNKLALHDEEPKGSQPQVVRCVLNHPDSLAS